MMLQLIKAIIRPEKAMSVITELMGAGYPAVTKLDVYGRGKQKGIVLNDIRYDELPKQMLLIVCEVKDRDDIVGIIMRTARTGEGHFGDGRIFVSPVEKAYTISSGQEGL
ncbi:MAG: P-II family nitrogen regulator [Deltaproteobacteria bacterium]|jgi:nitrogen regulatory protein PII 1|nr:P-II family nitrogen regulator [Deltaproteobacteria bacterium]